MGKFLLKVSSLAAALANINACFLSASAQLAQAPDGASLSFGSAPEIEMIFICVCFLRFFFNALLNIKSQSQAWSRH